MLQIDLSERVAVVTGATSSIGHATAVRLLEAGCTVIANVCCDTSNPDGRFLALMGQYGEKLHLCPGVVTDPGLARSFAASIKGLNGRLDIFINSAEIVRDNLIGHISDGEIDEVLDVNVAAVLRLMQFAARQMGKRRLGSIINLSSVIGFRGNAGQFVYGAAKAAVIGATLAAAKELAPKGIRVNAVAPILRSKPTIPDMASVPTRFPLGSIVSQARLGPAEEIADVILYLASDLSSYVTGQIIGVGRESTANLVIED